MPSAELTANQAPRELAADPQAPLLLPARGRGQAAFDAIVLRLRHALAESARAWALAAGVPPHLYDHIEELSVS